MFTSEVPKRGRSQHANARKRAQMNAKGRKRKSAKGAQKGAKERFRVQITNQEVWNH